MNVYNHSFDQKSHWVVSLYKALGICKMMFTYFDRGDSEKGRLQTGEIAQGLKMFTDIVLYRDKYQTKVERLNGEGMGNFLLNCCLKGSLRIS